MADSLPASADAQAVKVEPDTVKDLMDAAMRAITKRVVDGTATLADVQIMAQLRNPGEEQEQPKPTTSHPPAQATRARRVSRQRCTAMNPCGRFHPKPKLQGVGKRPISALLRFGKDKRPGVKARLQLADMSTPVLAKTVSSELGRMWNGLSEAEQAPYRKACIDEYKEYKARCAAARLSALQLPHAPDPES